MTQTVHGECLNCGAGLAGPFCSQCGQRDVPPHPTTRDLVGDAYDELVGWDGKFAQTIRLLLTRPGELTRAGTIGLAISFMAILLYVWLRFEWRFAVGAIIATMHDVLLTIGFLVLTGIEFNLGSIAAVLTIVGYSLNDTVVIYDRIRENLGRYPRMPLSVLIDTSINQTLSRTILTALTTILALAALYLFGGGLIRSFSVTMLFGVAVGTFSSIYIAGPVLILFRKRTDHIPGDENASGADTGAAGAAKGTV